MASLQLNLPAGALSNLGPHLGINTGPGAVIVQKTVGLTGACGGDDDRSEIFVFGLGRLNQLGHVGKHPLFGDGSNSTVIQHLLEHFVQLVTDHLTAFGFREEVCDVVCGQVFIQETELDGVIVVHEVVDIGGGVGKSVDSAEVQVVHGDRAVFVKNNFKADFLAHALDDGLCSLAVCAADPFPGQIRKGIDFFIRLGDDHALGIAVVGDGVIVLFDTLRLHGPAVCGDVSTTGVEHAPDGVKGGLLQLNLPAGALSFSSISQPVRSAISAHISESIPVQEPSSCRRL